MFLAESGAGRIRVFHAPDGAERPAETAVFASGLSQPFGIALWPPGPEPRFVYVAESSRVVRFPYRLGDLKARSGPEIVVSNLPTDGHGTRDLVFSADGRRMFVSVGSASNAGTDLRGQPPSGTPPGAAWGSEQDRADVLVFAPDGSHRQIFATGLRNCTALAIAPSDGTLWCLANERDELGDNLPQDYATAVRKGGFYGWPWFYIGNHEDPRLYGTRPDLASRVLLPDLLIAPHSAPLGITFYTGSQFPARYRGDAFVTFHGSWNRARRTGYKVVCLRLDHGKPTGEVEDFMTGFVTSDQTVQARPVGITVAHAAHSWSAKTGTVQSGA